MAKHYTATIKHTKNEPVGIRLKNDPINGLIISSIFAKGPFGRSRLRKGMKLRTINNVDVSGLSTKEAVKILRQTEGRLVIRAEKVMPAQMTFLFHRLQGGKIHARIKEDFNNAMPTIFNEAVVPSRTLSHIYKLVERDLLPAAAALSEHELSLKKELHSYVGQQMVYGGLVGYGTESAHEKRMFEMVLKSSHLERNVDLKAMQLTIQVNAMLAEYNLMATVLLEPIRNDSSYICRRLTYERLNVVGLKFHPKK